MGSESEFNGYSVSSWDESDGVVPKIRGFTGLQKGRSRLWANFKKK